MQAQLQVQQSVMASPTAVLVLEMYQWQTPGAAAARSDLRASAVSRLNHARSRGMADVPKSHQALSQLPTTLARASASSSTGSSSSSSSGGGNTETLGQSAQLTSESQSDADSISSHEGFGGGDKADSRAVLMPLGVARFPLRHIPEDRNGSIAELDGEIVGVGGGGAGGVQQGWPCVLEVQAWDAAQYAAEQLRGQQPNQSMTNEPKISLDVVTSPAYASHVMSVLTEDLLSKQTALEKLQRAVLRAEGSSQLGLWRVHEAEKRNGILAADLAQLRKLLHEEKSSSKVNSGADSSFFLLSLLLMSFFLCSQFFSHASCFLLKPSFTCHLPSSFNSSCMSARVICFLSVLLNEVCV